MARESGAPDVLDKKLLMIITERVQVQNLKGNGHPPQTAEVKLHIMKQE